MQDLGFRQFRLRVVGFRAVVLWKRLVRIEELTAWGFFLAFYVFGPRRDCKTSHSKLQKASSMQN